jgi:hypothetical protein
MKSKRKILCVARDSTGDEWSVTEARPTSLGWPVMLGIPTVEVEARAKGGPRVILTHKLLDYLLANRKTPGEKIRAELGLSKNAITNLRRTAGINRYTDARNWWSERTDDLRTLTLEQFAAKHGVKVGITEHWRLELIGKTNRDHGWYLDPSAVDALGSDLPAADVGTFLGGIPAGSVSRIRSNLRGRGLIPAVDKEEVRRKISEHRGGIRATKKTKERLLKFAKQKKSASHRIAIANALREYQAGQPKAPAIPGQKLWTPREDRILGQVLDRIAAVQLGRTLAAVRSRRRALGIPECRHAKLYRSVLPGKSKRIRLK